MMWTPIKSPTPQSEALKPILWFAAVCGAILIGSLYSSSEMAKPVAIVSAIFFGVFALVFIWAYWRLLTKDPDRLQSETFIFSVRTLGDSTSARIIDSPPVSNSRALGIEHNPSTPPMHEEE
jgi:choline-glycine betaine transporter